MSILKKPTMKRIEASKSDKKVDAKMGYKEGSKKDIASDKKPQAKTTKK